MEDLRSILRHLGAVTEGKAARAAEGWHLFRRGLYEPIAWFR